LVENKNKELLEVKSESESNNIEVENIRKTNDELISSNNKEIEALNE